MSAEITVIIINLIIILIAYFYIYPKYSVVDLDKMALNDVIATGVSLLVVGSIYWGTDTTFNAVIFELNWFWFSFVTYLLMEIPLAIWYWYKYKLGQSNKS